MLGGHDPWCENKSGNCESFRNKDHNALVTFVWKMAAFVKNQ